MGECVVPCGKCGGFKTDVHNLRREIPGWNNKVPVRQAPGGPMRARMMAAVGPVRPVSVEVLVP